VEVIWFLETQGNHRRRSGKARILKKTNLPRMQTVRRRRPKKHDQGNCEERTDLRNCRVKVRFHNQNPGESREHRGEWCRLASSSSFRRGGGELKSDRKEGRELNSCGLLGNGLKLPTSLKTGTSDSASGADPRGRKRVPHRDENRRRSTKETPVSRSTQL